MQGRFKKEGSATGEEGFDGPDGRAPSAGRGHDGEPPLATEDADPSAPERVAEETAEEEPREPSGPGSRLALRNWRISTRLISLIALPVVVATSLGAIRVQEFREDIEQLDHLQLLTDMTQQATALASALQEERDRSAGPLISGEGAKSGNIGQLRERTDEARQAFATETLNIDDNDEALQDISNRVLGIGRQLNQLKNIRDEAYEDPAYVSQSVSRYNDLIEALLGLSQDMALATSNSDMINSTRALAVFSEAKEYASIQRAMISGGFARLSTDGEGLSPSDWRFGKNAQENEQAAMRGFNQLYEDSSITEPLDGGLANVVSAGQLSSRIFDDPGALEDEGFSHQDSYDLLRSKIDAMERIEQVLLDEMEGQANALRADAQRDALLNAALTLLVLGVSLVGAFVVARSMVRTLRRLQDTAQEVAHKRLPEVVKQMSEADPQDVNTSVESVGVNSRDEIGKVAQAFDDVHRQAVRLAGEQALLRGNVNAMFTNLSRRSQGLIQRQLSLISELESREADPDQLASLFKLDHLATRMRRNGENLLVLAGEEPGRRWTRPVPLVDVLRAAASEVEQYERIELSAVPKTEVAGRVVNDLVHLLAELLENATSFSSPQTKVKVTGHALPDGRVLVEIHDTGIGLSPEDLAEINDRLANPPTVDVSVSRRMGLFVVGRLSLRHGIRIQLRPSDSGGTTALVMLPAEVAQTGGNRPTKPGGGQGLPERRPGEHAPGAGQGASATLQREPMPRRGGPEGQPSREQMPGAPARAALPSRPGNSAPAGGPGTPGKPGGLGGPAGPGGPGAPGGPVRPRAADPAGPGTPADPAAAPSGGRGPFTPASPPGSAGPGQTGAVPGTGGPALPGRSGLPSGPQQPRPSWAERSDDSGRIPAVRHGAEGPRGHDDPAATTEFPAFGGPPQRPGPASPGDRGWGGSRGPGDTTEIPAPVSGPGETGEFPQLPAQAPPPGRYENGPGAPMGQGPEHHPQQGFPPQRYDAFAQPARQQPEDPSFLPPAPDVPGRAPERTPIFEEIESTWFGARTAAPAETSRESAGSPHPQRPTAPLPDRTGGDGSPSAPPPRSGEATTAGGNPPQWRESPNDERWRRAEQLRSPAAGGVTTSGLPRRVPRANLVAGTAQEREAAVAPGPQVSRAPDAVRGRLTNLRRGIAQGRQAGASTGGEESTGQGFSSSYPQER